MSLSTPVPQFKLGIITSKAFDDPDFLSELVGPHLDQVAHIYGNGVNPLVAQFAADHGIPYTVYPLTNRSLPWSISQILEHVEFVYVIGDSESKSTAQIVIACDKKGVKHKVIYYTPYTHWVEKLKEVREIVEAGDEDNAATLAAVKKIL